MEYASQIHDNSGVNQYAQKFISTPGTQDGLAWQNPDGTWGGPIGDKVAEALAEGYGDKAKPFHGYYFKMLKGQGPNAPLGQLDYVIEGAMIGGFAMVAVPADYRVTGVNTFMVSYDGVVYQKDLGPDSLEHCEEYGSVQPRQDLAYNRRQLAALTPRTEGLRRGCTVRAPRRQPEWLLGGDSSRGPLVR